MTAPVLVAAIVAALAFVFLPRSQGGGTRGCSPGPYTVTDLGTFGGIQSAQATTSTMPAGGRVHGRQSIRLAGRCADGPGHLGGNSGLGAAINGVGKSSVAPRPQHRDAARAMPHAFWQNGVMDDLGSFPATTMAGRGHQHPGASWARRATPIPTRTNHVRSILRDGDMIALPCEPGELRGRHQ